LSLDVIRVSPFEIKHKLSCDLDDTEKAAWGTNPYIPLDQTAKHRAIHQRFQDGLRWEETELFLNRYLPRFGRGEVVRGCETFEELVEQYSIRVDGLFEHMRKHGFCERIDRDVFQIPSVVVGPEGLVLGNQGNHRIAMAKVLGLKEVVVRVLGEVDKLDCKYEPVQLEPVLHPGARDIPAMTTEAERFVSYQLARNAAGHGEICEIGTWLGAATVYIAAGIRDSGFSQKLHAYDRFKWMPNHDAKAGGPLARPMIEQFKMNLGPLLDLVEIHAGELINLPWTGGPIAFLAADGPKRTREISFTLTSFPVMPGGHMAWQDFGYFPSYDLPAAFAKLEATGKVELVDFVYPGTTAVFKVLEPWEESEVSTNALATKPWLPADILSVWKGWEARIPEAARPRFMCGAALFLFDQGAKKQAQELFADLVSKHRSEIVPKWKYLRRAKSSFSVQYAPLYQVIE
jgi:hypothetical protein